MNTIWCIIWRFQPFHKGHELLIQASENENDSTIIFIGSSESENVSNPYNFQTRKKIIRANFINTNISIIALPDFKTDQAWLEHILKKIPEDISRLNIYCGDKDNDSAIISIQSLEHTIPFSISITEIPRSIIPVSATQIRTAIKDNNTKFLNLYLTEETIKIVKK